MFYLAFYDGITVHFPKTYSRHDELYGAEVCGLRFPRLPGCLFIFGLGAVPHVTELAIITFRGRMPSRYC